MSEDIKAEVEAMLSNSSCAASEPFALRVIGDSMEPEFKDGTIIVIDPNGLVRDEAYVVALIESGYTLRQVKMEGDSYFIEPLNPDYMHERQQVNLDQIKGIVAQQAAPNGNRKQRKNYNQ
ncbi:MAG: S24 family peptidase [Gammaproteobacteria bacterium]|nr:S24 family peptidase [Gammaproteobacteria bacterium]